MASGLLTRPILACFLSVLPLEELIKKKKKKICSCFCFFRISSCRKSRYTAGFKSNLYVLEKRGNQVRKLQKPESWARLPAPGKVLEELCSFLFKNCLNWFLFSFNSRPAVLGLQKIHTGSPEFPEGPCPPHIPSTVVLGRQPRAPLSKAQLYHWATGFKAADEA